MEKNLQQFANTYAQGLWIAAAIFAALALFRLFLVLKNKDTRTFIFKAKPDALIIFMKAFFLIGLIAFLADIPVWFLAISQFRAVAPKLPQTALIVVLLWITLQELILSFTVSQSLKEQFIKRILFFLVSIFCGSSFMLAALVAPGTYQEPPLNETTILASPVKGTWYAMHAGGQKWVNYHGNYPPQNFAIDMVKIGESGQFFSNFGIDTSDFYSFGDSIFAPAYGVVLEAINGFPTQVVFKGEDTLNPAGNYIEIEVAANRFLFLAHLLNGSLQVQKGDTIKEGQFLAFSGNSGNTSFPHLHMHIQDKPILNDSLSLGRPFMFKNIERKRFLTWDKKEFTSLIRNDQFRN
ncbi:MAG: M23 family metallopeptidase [bacterium]|nr:M23 family metallopeptidase [bacterium]